MRWSSREEIDELVAGHDHARVLEDRLNDDPAPLHFVDRYPSLGYRFFSAGYGDALVSRDGYAIALAPATREAWRWQRLLLARVLPWAAVLQGYEVLHASAVVLGDQAVALVGPSGVGKSSLALHLVLTGGRLLTDDVLAIDRHPGGSLRGHPGPLTVGIREEERARLSRTDLSRLGRLSHRDGKSWAHLPGATRPAPVGSIVFVTRRRELRGRVARLEPGDPAVLLGSTFAPSIESPRRLENLLDICALTLSTTPLWTANVRPDVDAAGLARQLREHLL